MKVYLFAVLSFPFIWLQIHCQQNPPGKIVEIPKQETEDKKSFKRLVDELQKLDKLIDSSVKSDFKLNIVPANDVPELGRIVDQSLESTLFLESKANTNVPAPSLNYIQSMDQKADQIADLNRNQQSKSDNMSWLRSMRNDLLVKEDHAEKLPLTPFGDILVEVTTLVDEKPSGRFEVYFVCDDYKKYSEGHRFNKASDSIGKTSWKIDAGIYQLYTVALSNKKTRGDMKELILGKGMQNVEFDLPAKR